MADNVSDAVTWDLMFDCMQDCFSEARSPEEQETGTGY